MIDDAAREFGEWLADRLPEDMLMPSKSVAVQDAVDALGAILRKHAYPRLIESGPLPEGHLYVAFPKPGRGVRHPVALDRGADNPNHDEFDIFDYGPLPQKGGE